MTSEPQSTPAAYKPDLAIDVLKNQVAPVDTGGSRVLYAIRMLIGIPIFGVGTICLLFGLWPVTIGAILIGIPFVKRRRPPRHQRVGVWEGKCPRCGTAAYPHAPALADHYRFSCPGCTRPIMLRDKQYVAD